MKTRKKTKIDVINSLEPKDRDFHNLKKITFQASTETLTANITVRINDLGAKPPMYLYNLDNGFRYISSLYPLDNGNYRFDYQPKGDMTLIYEVDYLGNVVLKND